MSESPVPAAGQTVKDAATTAAAEAIEDAAFRWLGRDLGTIHRNEIVAEGLAAAVPVILDEAAAQIEEQFSDDTGRLALGGDIALAVLRGLRDEWSG